MKIELKRFSYSERLSEETSAFAADVWIDGKNVGYAKNDGHGGCTIVQINPLELREKVEAYARTLMPDDLKVLGFSGTEHIIDEMVEAELQRRHDERERKRIERFDTKERAKFSAQGLGCARFRVGESIHWVGLKKDQPHQAVIDHFTKKFGSVADWTVL